MTSTNGVTLISLMPSSSSRSTPAPPMSLLRCERRLVQALAAQEPIGALELRHNQAAQEIGVGHAPLELRLEPVEEHDRRNGDQQTDCRCDQRLRDARTDDLEAALGVTAELRERKDDADHRAEQPHE